jgi:hypothetical protein
MSHPEYFDHLFRIGTGWIGWSEEQTLDASMPAIEAAYAGRIELLQAIFGKPKEQEGQPRRKLTPAEMGGALKMAFRGFMAKGTGGGHK